MMYPLTYHSLFYLKAQEENRMSNKKFEIGRWARSCRNLWKKTTLPKPQNLVGF